MQSLMTEIMNKITVTRDAGQKEYARDVDNVFANFERVASFVGVNREKALVKKYPTHAYMISKAFALNIVGTPFTGEPIDTFYRKKANHAYALYPMIAYQQGANGYYERLLEKQVIFGSFLNTMRKRITVLLLLIIVVGIRLS